MSQIVTNIAGLAISQKLDKGGTIITASTNNPLVPGNGPTLTAFSAAQAALDAANANVLAIRDSLKLALVQRNDAEVEWDGKLTGLAGFTQAATGGNEAAIVSSGFSVRGTNTPPQPVIAPENLSVKTNGSPGVTKLRWKAVTGAVNYVIQSSLDPDTESTWAKVGTSTKSYTEVSGATPGKVCWYRVAALGVLGEGPWSEPARRPVM